MLRANRSRSRWLRALAALAVMVGFLTACVSDTVERPYADDPRRGEALEVYEAEYANLVADDVRPQYRCAMEAVIDIGGPSRFLGLVGEGTEQAEPTVETLADIKTAYDECGASGLMVAVIGGSGFGRGFSPAEPTIDRAYVGCVEQAIGGDIDVVVDYYLGLADELDSDIRDKVIASTGCLDDSASGPGG